MTPRDFVYWLQGFAEMTEEKVLSEKQWLIVKDHLKLVMEKETPNRNILDQLRIPTRLDTTTVIFSTTADEEDFAGHIGIPEGYRVEMDGEDSELVLDKTEEEILESAKTVDAGELQPIITPVTC